MFVGVVRLSRVPSFFTNCGIVYRLSFVPSDFTGTLRSVVLFVLAPIIVLPDIVLVRHACDVAVKFCVWFCLDLCLNFTRSRSDDPADFQMLDLSDHPAEELLRKLIHAPYAHATVAILANGSQIIDSHVTPFTFGNNVPAVEAAI